MNYSIVLRSPGPGSIRTQGPKIFQQRFTPSWLKGSSERGVRLLQTPQRRQRTQPWLPGFSPKSRTCRQRPTPPQRPDTADLLAPLPSYPPGSPRRALSVARRFIPDERPSRILFASDIERLLFSSRPLRTARQPPIMLAQLFCESPVRNMRIFSQRIAEALERYYLLRTCLLDCLMISKKPGSLPERIELASESRVSRR
jgi:hypothetical protein